MSTVGIWRSPATEVSPPEACPQTGPEADYTWRIENFSMCPQSKGESLWSTSFTVDSLDQSEFRLVLYPRGELEDEVENVVCFLECLVEPDYNVSVTMTVLGNGTTTPIVTKTKVCFIVRNGQRHGFVLLPDRKDLVTRRQAFLPQDVFTIRCLVSPQYRAPLVTDYDFLSLSNDFANLYKKGNFADFEVYSNTGKVFKVHKAILSIRGHDLAESFGMMGEKPVSLATRNDISGAALDVILAYIYSGFLAESLEPDVLNEVYQVSKRMKMDDLKRDIFPLETSTVATSIVKVDRRKISWALTDFHRRVEGGHWPIQTFVDLTVGRFILSFSLLEREGAVYTHIEITSYAVFVEGTVFMKCKVLVDHGDNGNKPELCSMERWFDHEIGDNTCSMDGDHGLLYAWRSLKQYPEKLSLVFGFSVSSPMMCMDCHNEEVTNWLETPVPSKRSMQRLSSDLDIVFRDTVEEDSDSDSDSDRDLCTFADLRIRTRNGKFTFSHRCILAARSEKFKDIIIEESTGSKYTDIDVTDMSDETLEDLLRYIYSGKMKEADMGRLMDLYIAANTYKVPALVKRCAFLVKGKITTSDVYNLLLLAEDYKDDSLLAVLVDYLCMNRMATLSSAEWQRVVTERPLLASKVLSDLSAKLGHTNSK